MADSIPASFPFKLPNGGTVDVKHTVSPVEPVGRSCCMPHCKRHYAASTKLAAAKAELAQKRMISGRKVDPTSQVTEGQKGEAFFNQEETIHADFCQEHLTQLATGKLRVGANMLNNMERQNGG